MGHPKYLPALAIGLPLVLLAHGNGAPAGRTGVEGESTCLNCRRGIRLYALLDLYARPFNSDEPVVCVDEKSKQLLKQTRVPIPGVWIVPAGREHRGVTGVEDKTTLQRFDGSDRFLEGPQFLTAWHRSLRPFYLLLRPRTR